jgi:hypothetical protein
VAHGKDPRADDPGLFAVVRDCHMPKIEQTIADVNVRSHTFKFIAPSATDRMKAPNACNVCHADKSTEWARAALKSWTDRSPWRVGQ